MISARFRLYTTKAHYLQLINFFCFSKITNDLKIQQTESELAKFLGVKNVILTPMCRTAIFVTLKTVISDESKYVILSPYTIADVVNMVICAGGIPVFCDVDKQGNLSKDALGTLINENTAAVLVTHIHGICADIKAIKSTCNTYNVPLFEDVAQAFGAKVEGHRLGSFGAAGFLSFGSFKILSSWYGGAVVTDDDILAKQIRDTVSSFPKINASFLLKKILKGALTDLVTHTTVFNLLTFHIFKFSSLYRVNWINKFIQTELDLNRYDEIKNEYLQNITGFQSDLILLSLRDVDKQADIRRRKALIYYQGLKDVEGITIPMINELGDDVFTYYPIQVNNLDALLCWFSYRNRDVGAQHLKNCADLLAYSEFYSDCPAARKIASSIVLLPLYPDYPDSEVEDNIRVIKEFYCSAI